MALQAVVEMITALVGHEASVVAVQYNRSSVGGASDVNLGKQGERGAVNIETRLRTGDPSLDRALVLSSLVAELDLLSSADALVGTSSSQVTRLAFLLIAARMGTVPPFSFLDAPFGWVLGPAGRQRPIPHGWAPLPPPYPADIRRHARTRAGIGDFCGRSIK